MALVIYLILPLEIDPSNPRLRITLASLGYSIIKRAYTRTYLTVRCALPRKQKRSDTKSERQNLPCNDAHPVGQLTT